MFLEQQKGQGDEVHKAEPGDEYLVLETANGEWAGLAKNLICPCVRRRQPPLARLASTPGE